MEFGVFYQLPCAEGQTDSERYNDTIAQARLADELGFETVWLAELHFNRQFSVMPAPLLVGSAIAALTERIKIGTAVNLVPLHHPIRLAEETATLDVLSHGRAIFGIGRGSMPSHYEGYGVDIAQGRELFREALEFILGAWTNDEFFYQGRFYQCQGLRIVPKPYQKPYPPVYVASNSPETFEIVGSLGHNILVSPLIVTKERGKAGLDVYRETLSKHGFDPGSTKVNINIPVYVSKESKRARAGFEPTINNYLSTLRGLRGTQGSSRASSLDYDQVYDEYGLVGDPSECVDKLNQFQEMYRPNEFMCWFNTGGMLPHEEVERSMRLFADKVMPHFR